MSGFWDKQNVIANNNPGVPAQQDMVLDEQAVAEIQGEQFDVFDDEEEDTQALMQDANLRLEQGRLYQMVLQGDIFADTNADPRAIKNVQREIRKYVRERMETMLGIRQEALIQETIVSSPFNDLEVTALKMLASKISGGKTETPQSQPELPPAQPKKDGITSISGALRPQTSTPLKKPVDTTRKPLSAAKHATKASPKLVKEEESALTKPIDQMTPQELAAHDAAALERSSRKYAAKPNNLVPHPSPQALEMMYTTQVNQNPAPGSAVAKMVDLINGRN
jgi:hypothetical protein